MNITNKYTKITIGNKTVTKKNFFLNSYLKLYSKGQLNPEDDTNYSRNTLKSLNNNLYIKLDTAIENVDYDTELHSNQFELLITKGRANYVKNKNNITAIYTYDTSSQFTYNNEIITDRSKLSGHKITALSFNLLTYLDVSEYDLYFIDDEVVTVVKEDLITTDAICSYDYPYHLSPDLDAITYGDSYTANVVARIYSVGLGRRAGEMEEEYIIGKDVKIIEEDDFTFNFVLSKATDEGIYPNVNGYPSIKSYPLTFKIKTNKYPTEMTWCSNNLYPMISDFKYIIIKYVFYYINRGGNIIDLDKYYTMSFYTNKEGILIIKNKIERR